MNKLLALAYTICGGMKMQLKWFQKNKEKQPPAIPPQAQAVVDAYRDPERQKIDPNGSYTGVAEPPYATPVQDADDL